MTEVMDRELVTIEPKNALSVFTEPKAIDPILARVRKEIDDFKPKRDVSTASGRQAIKSMAFKVTKSKTYLDGVGKKLVDEYKEIPKKIDATRKRVRDILDEWKDEVRRPLTEWEDAEEARVDAIKSALGELQGVIDDQSERPSELIRERLAEVKAEAITEQFYCEYTGAAAELKDKAIKALEDQLAKAEKREAEAAELARLRAEAEERARKEREEQIAREAAEAARKKAEADARAEKDRIEAAARAERETAEKRELQLRLEKEQAERRAIEAAEQAKRELEEKAARERAEQEKREADKKHRASVNRAALDAFVKGGIPKDVAKTVVELIAKKAIPAVTISY